MNLICKVLHFEQAWSEDKKRKSYLLNFINFSLLVFLLFVIGISIFGNFSSDINDNQENLWFLLAIVVVLLLFIFLVRKGLVRLVALTLISLLLLSLLKCSLTWGIDLCTVDIMYSFIILLSAILINSRFSMVILLVICLSLSAIFFLHESEIIIRDSVWQASLPSSTNLLIVIVIYTLMTALSWLSSCEIEKSLQKSKKLAKRLRLQNENLEKIVEQRTKELKTLQLNQLTRIAPLLDLGKLAAGLVHDVRQPLSVLNMILEEAKNNNNKFADIDLAFAAIRQIDDLSNISVTKFFCQTQPEIFSLNKEITKLLSLFKYKASKKKVRLIFQPNCKLDLHADRKKLLQVVANLIINAIEAYEGLGKIEQNVFIKLQRNSRHLVVTVKDYGVGISRQNLTSIFNPIFSLKNPENSLGLGLYVSQEIMQKFFETNIKVGSSPKGGTSFSLLIKNKFIL